MHGQRSTASRHHDVTSGKLHNDTAYGITGLTASDGKTPIVVHRVPFASLKAAQIADPDAIPDETLRNALQLATRDLSGEAAFKQALTRFAQDHPVFKGIRRVRLREPLNVIPIHDISGKPYKAVKGNGNDRIDIWRLPDGKWTPDVVSTFEAHDRAARDRRPHPAAKKVLSLRQGDVIAVERDGKSRELLVIKGFNQNGRLTLAPPNEGGKLQERDRTGNDIDPFKYVYLSAGSLKKAGARQVRIDQLGRVSDPGPRA